MLATSLSHADSSLLQTEKPSSSESTSSRLPFFSNISSRRARAAARSSALRAWNSSSDLIWFWKNLGRGGVCVCVCVCVRVRVCVVRRVRGVCGQ